MNLDDNTVRKMTDAAIAGPNDKGYYELLSLAKAGWKTFHDRGPGGTKWKWQNLLAIFLLTGELPSDGADYGSDEWQEYLDLCRDRSTHKVEERWRSFHLPDALAVRQELARRAVIGRWPNSLEELPGLYKEQDSVFAAITLVREVSTWVLVQPGVSLKTVYQFSENNTYKDCGLLADGFGEAISQLFAQGHFKIENEEELAIATENLSKLLGSGVKTIGDAVYQSYYTSKPKKVVTKGLHSVDEELLRKLAHQSAKACDLLGERMILPEFQDKSPLLAFNRRYIMGVASAIQSDHIGRDALRFTRTDNTVEKAMLREAHRSVSSCEGVFGETIAVFGWMVEQITNREMDTSELPTVDHFCHSKFSDAIDYVRKERGNS